MAYPSLARECAYHVLDVEAVLGEPQNETSFADALIAQEDNLKLHLAGKTIAVYFGHYLIIKSL